MTATTDSFIRLKTAGQIKGNEFTNSLEQAILSGRFISEKRMYWIAKLVDEANRPAPAAPVTLAGNVQGIFTLFDVAKSKGIKFPKVKLATEDGFSVVLKQAGQQSKYMGQIMLTDGMPFGQNRFFGRIDEAGRLIEGRDMTDSVRALIAAFAADPAKVGAAYGKRTGTCCFCSRHLETRESVHVGYGPICAEKFGLPWGEVPQAEIAAPAASEVAPATTYVLPSFVAASAGIDVKPSTTRADWELPF